MAYDADGLICTQNYLGAVGGTALSEYSYVTNDLKATVEGSGYFDAEITRFKVGDTLDVNFDLDGTPGKTRYVVSSVTTHVALTADVLGTSATSAEIDRVADVSARVVTLANSTSITELTHDSKVLLLTGTGAAKTQTLPAATGSGARFLFIVGAVNTSNHVIQVTGNDVMYGNIVTNSTGDTPDLGQPWPTAVDSDTITLNGTTTGGQAVGDFVELIDIAPDKWFVRGITTTSGTEATPFSAAV